MSRAALAALLLVAACPSTQPTPAPQAAPSAALEEITVNPQDLSREVARAAKEAKARGKRVFVDLHADWCAPCQEVKKALARPENAGTLKAWAVAKVNVDAVPDGPILGIDVQTIPFLIKLDDQGRVVGTTNFAGVPLDDPHMIDAALKAFLVP